MKVAVVYDSGYGHTEVVALKIVEGLNSGDVKAQAFKAKDINDGNVAIEELEKFDGIIFGSPTYMGSVSAEFKKFMDLSSKVWYGQKWKDKIAAGFTNSAGLSGDKANTLNTLVTFACQHSMIWVSQGLFPDGKLNRLGSWVGVMTQSDNAPATETPGEDDKNYAFAFGKRIASFMVTKLKNNG
jgi:NAD(P)H dehydrogenase (quinone)